MDIMILNQLTTYFQLMAALNFAPTFFEYYKSYFLKYIPKIKYNFKETDDYNKFSLELLRIKTVEGYIEDQEKKDRYISQYKNHKQTLLYNAIILEKDIVLCKNETKKINKKLLKKYIKYLDEIYFKIIKKSFILTGLYCLILTLIPFLNIINLEPREIILSLMFISLLFFGIQFGISVIRGSSFAPLIFFSGYVLIINSILNKIDNIENVKYVSIMIIIGSLYTYLLILINFITIRFGIKYIAYFKFIEKLNSLKENNRIESEIKNIYIKEKKLKYKLGKYLYKNTFWLKKNDFKFVKSMVNFFND